MLCYFITLRITDQTSIRTLPNEYQIITLIHTLPSDSRPYLKYSGVLKMYMNLNSGNFILDSLADLVVESIVFNHHPNTSIHFSEKVLTVQIRYRQQED